MNDFPNYVESLELNNDIKSEIYLSALSVRSDRNKLREENNALVVDLNNFGEVSEYIPKHNGRFGQISKVVLSAASLLFGATALAVTDDLPGELEDRIVYDVISADSAEFECEGGPFIQDTRPDVNYAIGGNDTTNADVMFWLIKNNTGNEEVMNSRSIDEHNIELPYLGRLGVEIKESDSDWADFNYDLVVTELNSSYEDSTRVGPYGYDINKDFESQVELSRISVNIPSECSASVPLNGLTFSESFNLENFSLDFEGEGDSFKTGPNGIAYLNTAFSLNSDNLTLESKIGDALLASGVSDSEIRNISNFFMSVEEDGDEIERLNLGQQTMREISNNLFHYNADNHIKVAEKYNLSIGDSIEVDGKTLTLEEVGSNNTAIFTVDGVTEVVAEQIEQVNGIKIGIRESFYSDNSEEHFAVINAGEQINNTEFKIIAVDVNGSVYEPLNINVDNVTYGHADFSFSDFESQLENLSDQINNLTLSENSEEVSNLTYRINELESLIENITFEDSEARSLIENLSADLLNYRNSLNNINGTNQTDELLRMIDGLEAQQRTIEELIENMSNSDIKEVQSETESPSYLGLFGSAILGGVIGTGSVLGTIKLMKNRNTSSRNKISDSIIQHREDGLSEVQIWDELVDSGIKAPDLYRAFLVADNKK